MVAAQLEALAVERYPILETEKFHREVALARGSLRSGFKEGYATLEAENARLLARNAVLEKALNLIDALDPEDQIYGCSHDATRGLVIQMGQHARAALTPTKENEHAE